MLVLAVAAAVALLVGGVVAVVARRWPRLDPTSPGGGPADDPETADVLDDDQADRLTVIGLSAAAVAAVVCATLFGLLVLLVRSRSNPGLDTDGATWAARHATEASTSVLRLLTHLGSTAFALPLAVVVGVVEHRRRPNRAILAFLLTVEAGQVLLVTLVKELVGRARPDVDQLAAVSTHSFPSGHTATAAATFAALALLTGRSRSISGRAVLAGIAAGLVALVASTRVLLGVHWVTDVLGGAALGWGWAALCSIAFGGRMLRFGAPLEPDQADGATEAASLS